MGSGKRTKQYKKTLQSYESVFGFHHPFQIIVDPEFLRTSLQQRINIFDEFSKILSTTSIKPMTTECIRRELRKIDEAENIGCYVAAKRYEIIRICNHSPCLSSKECILDVVGKQVNKFIIASNDPELKEELRKIPGIPLIFNHKGKIMMEAISEASKLYIKKHSADKLSPSEKEKIVLQKMIPISSTDNGLVRNKRKRAKQPNPLSCKKKKADKQTKAKTTDSSK